MKIALVSPYDFAFPGGVGRHIANLEKHFTRLGHEVKIIAPTSKPITDYDDRFIQIGKPVAIPASSSVMRISISLHLAPTVKEVLGREKFDIIHFHEPFMPMVCSAILRFSNTVNVGTFHAAKGRPGYNWGRPVSSWMLEYRRRHLHGHIAVSVPAMRYAQSFVPAEYEIIPNGVDTKKFRPDVEPLEQYMDGKQNIVFLSRLEFRKGANYLLKAFVEIKRQMPNTRLLICGSGVALRKRYEAWVQRNCIPDVIFTGMVPEQDIPRYYRTGDVFCLPATGQESFGLILIEAMATGRPIVATNIEGYASVITQGEEGLLVPPRTVKPLAEAIMTLLVDEKRRKEMGAKGIITAQKYEWEGIAHRVLDYYNKTIARVQARGKVN